MSTRAVAAAVLLALVASIAATARTARADVIAAIAPATDDVRKTIVVGPSGQVYEPDGSGTWTRKSEGGVAADVRGAVVAGSALVVAGKSAPLYRRDPTGWIAMRLGERGKSVIGSGPRPAIAIGKNVFVWAGSSWKRVGRTTANIAALWAASETKIVVATDAGLVRFAGGGFAPVPAAPVVAGLGSGGPTSWAVTADAGAYEVATRRIHRPTVGGAPMAVALVATSSDSTWAFGSTPAGIALARFHKGAWSEAIAPPVAADDSALALVADTSGALLVVTRGGLLHLLPAGAGATWSTGTRAEALPPATPGPGPARGR
ncbi:MAG TPA: hypothetical protein VM261_10340 [Kofleriaceae bacterium]|nr:hypothetical protein [Kofleriaceae bacterium]